MAFQQKEQSSGHGGADAKRQTTATNLAEQVRKEDAKMVKKVTMDPFWMKGAAVIRSRIQSQLLGLLQMSDPNAIKCLDLWGDAA